ncbi:hypothetical protein BJ508DRAFT_101378 [Ascobolus immersus RN42]|uniref:C2H2-type domain-containing protein n=1 Tax=Ascobolus immersus RN42 TaxID=1160509 RepID=A0A3N4I7S5_ASCIM|nr:hypothetical protein BJ508DRAFT_101378 [Ascobolus immersus RN42]
MSASPATMVAIQNALKDGSSGIPFAPSTYSAGMTMSNGIAGPVAGYPSPPSSLTQEGAGPLSAGGMVGFGYVRKDATPQVTSPTISTQANGIPIATSKRNRRASEGAHMALEGGGKSTAGELKCDKCGKGYKHGSCLTKHLWEHTPEWQYTSKLLISKHQQVQLLEAASILVSMKPSTPPDSSSEDSPPPQTQELSPLPTPTTGAFRGPRARSGTSSKRLSAGFSRSYSHQTPASLIAGSAPVTAGFPAHISAGGAVAKPRPRGASFANTPRAAAAAVVAAAAQAAAGTAGPGNEDESLAAAVGLLSCSFGSKTPVYGSLRSPNSYASPTPIPPTFQESTLTSPSLASRLHHASLNDRDVVMKIEENDELVIEPRDQRRPGLERLQVQDEMAIDDDDDEDWGNAPGRGKSEDDDGVFGKMDE